MYQNCCKKCGSTSLHTEVKGNNTGLYCDDCGAWIKWLGKDELRAFEYTKQTEKQIEKKTYTTNSYGFQDNKADIATVGMLKRSLPCDDDFITIMIENREYIIDGLRRVPNYTESPSSHVCLECRSCGTGEIRR